MIRDRVLRFRALPVEGMLLFLSCGSDGPMAPELEKVDPGTS
jgi:hypothetical protein